MFKVQSKQCETCIYRSDSPLDLKQLESQIADPHMERMFAAHRICHHSNDVCCRGFWDRHKDDFPMGQIAQRLDAVEFVNVDKLKRK